MAQGPRSCFGPADSWFIKEPGGNSCRGELRVRAKLTLRSPFVVSSRSAPDDSWNTRKALFAGDNHADTADFLLRIRRRSGADRACRLAGSSIRRQPPRRQRQPRTDAAVG